MTAVERTTCAIAGGGPAGMMLGLLLARRGVEVLVLEKHGDFLRDFRGDTIHPSTLEIMADLGLSDELLKLPHTKARRLRFRTPQGTAMLADFRGLPTRFPYLAFMPQWDFLDFIADEAKKYPNFHLRMNAEVMGVIREEGVVGGLRYTTPEGGEREIRAELTVAADGRDSVVRRESTLPVVGTAPPIDVLWFRLSRRADEPEEPYGYIGNGDFFIFINRGEYWQVARVIRKDADHEIRAAGLEAFRRHIGEAVPEVADRARELESWDQIKLLSVQVNRLKRWHEPGLLFIGDSAHAMSPVGGVGINLAIQDAVAVANELSRPLLAGRVETSRLRAVQKRRELPVRVIQAMQAQIHRRVVVPTIGGGPPVVPTLARPLLDIKPIRRIPARLIGLGVRRERVK